MSLSKDLSAYAPLFNSVYILLTILSAFPSVYLSVSLLLGFVSFVPLFRYVRLWPFLESAWVLSHEICLSLCLSSCLSLPVT
jgi:hypothetical protein